MIHQLGDIKWINANLESKRDELNSEESLNKLRPKIEALDILRFCSNGAENLSGMAFDSTVFTYSLATT